MHQGRKRNTAQRMAAIGLLTLSLATLTACEEGIEFRSVAGPGVKEGVVSIVNGLLDGVFAVVEPGTSTTDGSSTTDSAT